MDSPVNLTPRQIWIILSGLMLGMFLAALDQTIVSTSIRTIADDLHGLTMQAWATTAYLLTSTVTTPLYGKLSDIYGRKPFFMGAICIFVVGSVLCGMAGSMIELAVYRGVQGVGAGGLFSLALAILGDIVPVRDRAKYQGLFLAVFGTSSVLGPVVGGALAGADTIFGVTGWRWVFLLNVPIGILALVVVMKVLRVQHHRHDHRIDWMGALLLVVGLVPLLLVLELGREWGWTSWRSVGGFVTAGVALVLFVLAEKRFGDEALLPTRLFRSRTLTVGSVLNFIVGAAMLGGLAAIPLYLQLSKGKTPTMAGLLMLPLVVGIMISSMASGQIVSKTGRYKFLPILGCGLLVVGAVLMTRLGVDVPLWQTSIAMVVFGLGLGFNMQPLVLAVQNASDPRDMGVSTASVTFFRQVGGTIGTAIFLTMLFSAAPGHIADELKAAVPTGEYQSAMAQVAQNPSPGDTVILGVVRAAQGGGQPGTTPGAPAPSSSGGPASSGGQSPQLTLDDSSFLNSAHPTLARPFFEGFARSISPLLWVTAAIAALGFLLAFALPELPLQTRRPGEAPPVAE